jgi:hypothetical protein
MKKITLISVLFFSITSFAQFPNYVPYIDLVGWWPFNGNADDESGNGNNGINNGATLTTDRFGNLDKAYQFNNNSINIPLTQTLVNMSNRTISLWFKSSMNQSGGRLFETTNYSWGIGCYNSTNFDCWYQKSDQAYNFVGESFQNHNEWYNLVYVCDSSNQQKKLYLNGNLINSGSPVTNSGNPTDYINHYLKIGMGNANESFSGAIDDIGIWNRVLSDCEIKNLYNAHVGPINLSGGNDITACQGDSITLTATGADNYIWTPFLFLPEVNAINGQPFLLDISTNFYVHGIDSLGCVGTDIVSVTIINTVVTSQTIIEYDTYTWPVNNLTYTNSGTYMSTLTSVSGCDSLIVLYLTINTSGLFENTVNKITISPNPFEENFVINGLDMINNIHSIRIVTIFGNVIKELDPKTAVFNLENAETGVYFLIITSDKNEEVIKILKA